MMLKYDIGLYRDLFPIVQTGTIYLNHAATSPMSSRVVAAVNKYIEERTETRIDNFAPVSKTMSETRQLAASLLNSTADRIAFCDNTSNALNIVATGMEWKPGDRIILNDIEFPANVYPFLNLKRLGVEIDFVTSRDGRIIPEDVEHLITDRTRLVSISQVQFLSGFRADLESIGKICKNNGVVFCVDGIQAAGVVPADIGKMNIDFFAAGGQKWLMAPQGTGFAFVSERLQEELTQAYLGWTSMKNFFGNFTEYRIELDPTARRYENGTPNHLGLVSLHASVSTLLEVGINNIEEHVLDLNDMLISELDSMGLKVFVSGPRSERAGIVSAKIADPERIYAGLSEAGIEVATRQGWLRISPHFYNNEDDIRALVRAMKGLRVTGV